MPVAKSESAAKEALLGGSLASPERSHSAVLHIGGEGSSVHGRACEQSARAEGGYRVIRNRRILTN